MTASRPLAILLVCAGFAAAQARVEIGAGVVHESQYFDVDTGTVLSKARLESVRAEWKLEVDGDSVRVVPCPGATLARWDGRLGTDGPEPNPAAFLEKPVTVAGPLSIAGRTSEGRLFKALLTPPWPESFSNRAGILGRQVGSDIQVDFALFPDGDSAGPAALDIRAHCRQGKGVVTWRDAGKGSWRVEWFRNGVKRHDGSVTVDGPRAELDGLEEGKIYRVVVTPVGEGIADGEPRSVPLLAAEQGLRKFRFESNLEGGAQGIAVDLSEGREGSARPDCTFDYTFVRAPEGGGVQWLGDEKADFTGNKELPEFGYRSRVMISQKGGVFAVRMRDGRFAKVWFDWDRQSRERMRIIEVHGLVLLGGGRGSNPPPEGFTGTFKDGGVQLNWRRVKDAARYVIASRDGDGDEAELGETETLAFVDQKALPLRSVEYSLCWIDADGVRSAPAIAVVETWPPEYARGSATIRWIDGSFDFRTFKATDRMGRNNAVESDFRFDRMGAGREGIPLVCDAGIAKEIPGEFGRFDWKEAARFKRDGPETTIYIPHHLEKPVVLRLLTRDGGYAHVRFERMDGFDLKMSWVHLTAPKIPDFATMSRKLLERAPEMTAEQSKEMKDLVAQLAADDAEAREAAEKRLTEAGMKAIRELVEASTTSKDAEQRARIARVMEKIWIETE